MELKTLITGIGQLKQLVGEYDAFKLLQGKHVFLHGFTHRKMAEDLATALSNAGLFAYASESREPGKYSILTYLK